MSTARLTSPIDGIELVDGGADVTLRATHDLAGFASHRFAEPTVGAEIELGLNDDVELLGFAFTQFAMPVIERVDEPFDFAPAPNLRSPRAVLPLLARDSSRVVLLAPLTNPHEQVITVVDGVVRWGWHGDLDEVPAGFETTLGRYEGESAGDLLTRWAADLDGVPRAARSGSAITSRLSYWTDNGAAYWYRTEPDKTIAESVVDAVNALRADGVPIGAIELDSWFYPHETSRPIAAFGYPEEVPPTGMLEWQPRPDAFPAGIERDPIEWLASECEGLPLTLHARHISPESPYVDENWWVDRGGAQPKDPEFFRRWFDDAARWGATCIEQDWMLLGWFGTRDIRRVPGRADAWQTALNHHANETGIDLIWCMATPPDLISAARLDRVVAVRTSDDYRFAEDPVQLWTWFLTVNRLIAPLGLWPFKDCFFSNPEPDPADSISGDVNAELEALLSAMSGGPVGIGDRIGHTDRSVVMRTCDDAGRLLQPDTPIGLIDDCLFGSPARGERLAWATATTMLDGRTWNYVVAINTADERRAVADSLPLAEIGIEDARHVHDWRSDAGRVTDLIEIELAPRDWALFIVCPRDSTDVGDTTKFVTMART